MTFNESIITDTLSAARDTLAAVNSASNTGPGIWEIVSEGLILSVVGYVIVFAALILLFVFIKYLGSSMQLLRRRKLRAAGSTESEADLDIPGEITAAISTAIMLHLQEVHDFENTVITIKKVQSPYSPWSSKLYGLRQRPTRN